MRRRLIGSIRRACLDHVTVSNERGLRRVLEKYVTYYLKSRTHLSLDKAAPVSRPVGAPGNGPVIAIPQLVGCTTTPNAVPRSSRRIVPNGGTVRIQAEGPSAFVH
jgi:hypothetical protein